MNNYLKVILIVPAVAGAMLLTGCNSGKNDAAATKAASVPAIDLTAMDTTVRPQDDFYHYVNGQWIKNNPLKPAYSRYGSFDVLADSTLERVHGIVETLAKGEHQPGTNEYRVATVYRQAMDSATRNSLGAKPIIEELKRIEAIADKAQAVNWIAESANEGSSILFGSYVYTDPKSSNENMFHLVQPSLSLRNKDYYTKTDANSLEIMAAYKAYMEQIAKLAGYEEADAKRMAENALKLEKEIAVMSYSNEELRDTYRNYNKIEVKGFADTYSAFDWNSYLKVRNLSDLKDWDVSQLDYFKRFDTWFAKVDINELKDFFLINNIMDAAPFLSDDFVKANFDFFSAKMSGTKEQHPRWRRAVNLVNDMLGEALGEVYVKQYFPPEAKERMLVMVKNLQTALGERIANLDWMSDETKAKAQEKLNAFTVKIGYPDKWKDYSTMKIAGDSFYANIKSVRKWAHEDNMADLNKPVDRDRWHMNPQDVNAYYNPTSNEICFPAAILQPPFFNMDADDAVNYGGIGVVIGHEMTHGFDDQGRNFDKDGNMNDWWTNADAEAFNASAAKLAKQFDAIEIAPGLMANGSLTLGENIADQGGVLVSHMALHNALRDKAKDSIDGFSIDQRFFIGYARLWGQNITPEEEARLTQIDVHSLGLLRVNQCLRNIDAFYDAFRVSTEDKMYLAPEQRVIVW